MKQEKVPEKDYIKSVLRTLNLQALVLSLIILAIVFHLFQLMGSYFNNVSRISNDLVEVIAQRFSEDISEQTAKTLAVQYFVLIRYRAPSPNSLNPGSNWWPT